MKIFRIILKLILCILSIPVIYMIVSIILTSITINDTNIEQDNTETIYLSTNGVHLNIIIEKQDLQESLIRGLNNEPSDNYFAIGWGDEEFYLNTPEWSDLTLKTTFQALFRKGSSLIHITRYNTYQSDWIAVNLSPAELHKVNELILESFETDTNGNKILLKGAGYFDNDNFYRAKGSYFFYKTCNSWVNTIFKKSDLKACLWTPFDFGLLNKYK